MVLSLVAAGKGVSPAGVWAAEYHVRPGLVFVPFHDAPPIESGLVWPTARQTPLVEAFAQAVAAVEVNA